MRSVGAMDALDPGSDPLIRGDSAKSALPEVTVPREESRHHDLAGGIVSLVGSCSCRRRALAHGRDASVVADEEIAGERIRVTLIQSDDCSVGDQELVGGGDAGIDTDDGYRHDRTQVNARWRRSNPVASASREPGRSR